MGLSRVREAYPPIVAWEDQKYEGQTVSPLALVKAWSKELFLKCDSLDH
jgi:hypothetical protein